MKYFIWIIAGLLFVGWVLGFLVFKILGGLIHLLLVLAIILIIINWFKKVKEKI